MARKAKNHSVRCTNKAGAQMPAFGIVVVLNLASETRRAGAPFSRYRNVFRLRSGHCERRSKYARKWRRQFDFFGFVHCSVQGRWEEVSPSGSSRQCGGRRPRQSIARFYAVKFKRFLAVANRASEFEASVASWTMKGWDSTANLLT